jgi:hypothetical protein
MRDERLKLAREKQQDLVQKVAVVTRAWNLSTSSLFTTKALHNSQPFNPRSVQLSLQSKSE